MNRLGLQSPSELSGDAKALHDAFDEYTSSKYGAMYVPSSAPPSHYLLASAEIPFSPSSNPRNPSRPGLTTKDNQGRFIGPFGAQLHTPGVGRHFLGMTQALAKIPGLGARDREIAIVTVGARFDSAFELHSHRILAERQGMSGAEYEAIVKGVRPESFDESGRAVYDVAYELAYGSGPLSQGAWDKAVAVLGKDGVTALVQYVGFYSYVCMILRGFDCRVPGKDE